jgi:putative oxidoreductase
MAVARVGTEMRVEPDPKQLYFSAIALGPVFLIPTVRERRSNMFEIGENSVIGRYAEKSQPSKALNITFWVLQVLLAAAFLISGATKVAGTQMHVATFEDIGLGQWFRYVTGFVEMVFAFLVLIPKTAVLGAALLVATMICAVTTHLLLIGGSPLPAVVLLAIAGLVAWYRGQYS